MVGTMANSEIFQTNMQLKREELSCRILSTIDWRHQPVARYRVQVMSIRTEFEISDDFTVTAERCHAFWRDGVPKINVFIRAWRGQIASRGVDVDLHQITRIVIHRAFACSNTFSVLRVINSDHSILTRRTNEFTRVINGQIVEGLFFYDVIWTDELIFAVFILRNRSKDQGFIRTARDQLQIRCDRWNRKTHGCNRSWMIIQCGH